MAKKLKKSISEPGVYPDISFAEYRSIEAYNPTTVKRLIDYSPRHMLNYMMNGDDDTESKSLGRATHTAVFEPDDLLRKYATWTGGRRYGTAWDEFKSANSGKEIITSAEYETCLQIRDAVRNHADAGQIVSGGSMELSIVWRDAATGLLCKGRVDHLRGTTVSDLKTAADVRPFQFMRQSEKYLYHVSLGAYVDGLRALGLVIDHVVIIAVENKMPHDVVVYDVPPRTLRAGFRKWREALHRIAWCSQNDTWPGIADGRYEFDLHDAGNTDEIQFTEENHAEQSNA